jgi:hypothetical protein
MFRLISNGLIKEYRGTRISMLISLLSILFCYSLYAWCSDGTIEWLGLETAPVELGTSLFFLIGSVLFFICYRSSKSVFFLLMGIAFFFAAGEEISWGQQLYHFETPEEIKAHNVQEEFNIHNLQIFNTGDSEHVRKTGLARLLEFNFLFRLSCLLYGIVLPLLNHGFPVLNTWLRRIKLPVPPFTLGIFFMVNWLIFRLTLTLIKPDVANQDYYNMASESFEGLAALSYLLISIYWYKQRTEIFELKDATVR